ncbi:MAG: lysophospholipid acyltransferase family protein [bacterium]
MALDIKTRLVSWLGWLFIWFVGKTSIIKRIDSPGFLNLKEKGENFIYCFWHGRQLFLVYSHRGQDICILISESKDGEYIAQITRLFGFRWVRGSSSHGGMRALIRMKKQIEAGYPGAFTPDGPRGPFQKVQPGVIYAAQKTGRPIIPLTFGARRKKVIKNWDEFLIPYPFNYIVVMHGDPFYVSPGDDTLIKAGELEKILTEMNAKADGLCE